MSKSLTTPIFLLFLSFLIIQCAEDAIPPENGTDGLTALVVTENESAGENCTSGGIKITVGLDSNSNGTLDQDEIQSTSYVCNGTSAAANLLALTTNELAGANCEFGGVFVEIGADTNSNGSLETEEVLSSFFVCNGDAGQDGQNGTNGTNGISSITRATPETPGSNCVNGGVKIEIGLDVNSDGVLDTSEIEYTYFVCNGADGSDGLNTLVSTAIEPSGSNCAEGGLAITVGLDSNRNGAIDAGEEISTNYVCNGTNGTNGESLTVITESASSCSNGGSTFTFGYDRNNDGDLLDPEDLVLETVSICNGVDGTNGTNGTDGLNTIIVTTTEPPGSNCTNGGQAFLIGLDANRNNTIDAGEEVGTYYVCNGSDGSNGSNSLIEISTFSGNQNGCLNGGLTINTGVDDNSDGVLQAGEIDATSYVCNGTNGTNGTNGNSDNVFEFYFSEGFDGYTGVRDVAISDKNATETGETFSVARNSIDYHGLLYFPDIEKLEGLIGSKSFEIVEAVLYLRGISTRVDGVTEDNWIGVKNLQPSAPLFIEDQATWNLANSTPESWSTPGASTTEDGGAYDYSDMFQLPHAFVFNGYIPLLLNRSEVTLWSQDPANNKGLVLEMVNNTIQYELDVFSSNYSKDTNFRPTLYIKAKIVGGGRSAYVSDEQYKMNWNSKSYLEKLEPLSRR